MSEVSCGLGGLALVVVTPFGRLGGRVQPPRRGGVDGWVHWSHTMHKSATMHSWADLSQTVSLSYSKVEHHSIMAYVLARGSKRTHRVHGKDKETKIKGSITQGLK